MFYDNYVRLCNSIGKTPSAVAKEIGIQKSTVTRWGQGTTPNRATALKVADYFDVPLAVLTGDTLSLNDMLYLTAKDNGLDAAKKLLKQTEKATSDTGGGEVPHEQYREVLAGHGIRLLLDADAKVTMEQLNDIVDYINFQQRKNNR